MAIDTVRLLTESAAQLWQRLSRYSSIETLSDCDGFEVWLARGFARPALDQAEEQLLRRDYRRLCEILTEIETLVHSRDQAIALIRTCLASQTAPTSLS